MSTVNELTKVLEKAVKDKPTTPMRRFYFKRNEDVHGISGNGYVAEGIEFSDGTCVIRWLTESSSTTMFKSAADMIKIHGHEGRTLVVYEDIEVKKAEVASLEKALASSQLSGIDINTADYSQDAMAAQDNPWRERLKEALANFSLGDIPREIPLEEGYLLVASQMDNGIYDGFVKDNRQDSGEFGQIVFQIAKMPLDAMVQALMAKEFISKPKMAEPQPTVAPPQPSQAPVPAEPTQSVPELIGALESALGLPVSTEEQIYVSFDGDNIGNKVAAAEEKNDEDALKDVSNKIYSGQDCFRKWVAQNNGIMVQEGGDEGLARFPRKPSDGELEAFRRLYKEATGGFSVTMGIGKKIGDATKARMLGKLLGKDRVQVYDKDTKDQLKQKLEEKGPQTEADKLKEAGLGKSFATLADDLQRLRKSLI